jgi:hypothetical protein
MRHSIVGSICAGALCLIAPFALASPVTAAGPTCTVTANSTYSPGLTLEPKPQTVRFSADYTSCITPGRPDITSGSRSRVVNLTRGCLDAQSSYSQTLDIIWNTGETSTVTATTTPTYVAGQLVNTTIGTVTAGLFAGSSFTHVLTQANLDLLACAIPPGVQSLTGVGTVTIL